MIRGTVTGWIVAPVELTRSTADIPMTVITLLVPVEQGAHEMVAVVVRDHDFGDLPLQTRITAEGDLRLARMEGRDGPVAQFVMRARRVEVIGMTGRNRHIDEHSDENPHADGVTRQITKANAN